MKLILYLGMILREFNEMMLVKCLALCLAHNIFQGVIAFVDVIIVTIFSNVFTDAGY